VAGASTSSAGEGVARSAGWFGAAPGAAATRSTPSWRGFGRALAAGERVGPAAAGEAVVARAAVERVVVVPAAEAVGALVAEEAVASEGAGEEVVVGPAVQRVVAVAAEELVDASVAEERVVAAAAVHAVVAGPAVEGVGLPGAGDAVVARPAEHRDGDGAGAQRPEVDRHPVVAPAGADAKLPDGADRNGARFGAVDRDREGGWVLTRRGNDDDVVRRAAVAVARDVPYAVDDGRGK
jgi:hypothetical protein